MGFNLSEKMFLDEQCEGIGRYFFAKEDVKEFIRLLKEEIKSESGSEYGRIWDKLDKIAGEKLI